MQLYMIISIAVVLLSTVVLYFIFQRNNLKDLRYTVGLAFSAIIACAGSLLFPGFVAILSANNALRFFIVFFLSILIYIFVLFIVLILVFQIVPKEKADELVQKWEEKKLKRKNERELRLKEKEAQAAQKVQEEQAAKADTGVMTQEQTSGSGSFSLSFEEAAAAIMQQSSAEAAITQSTSETPVETVSKTSSEDAGLTESLVAPEQQAMPEQPAIARETVEASSEAGLESGNEEVGVPENLLSPEQLTTSEQPAIARETVEASAEVSFGSDGAGTPEDLFASVQPADLVSEGEPAAMIRPDSFGKEEQQTGSVENLPFSSVVLQDKIESNEKIVDTSDIIDKMGIDAVTDSAHPVPEQQGNSLTEIIQKAFLLKQQGDITEAAALYMAALDQKPDNETAFWIVLDICAIYKTIGHADLAEDILLTYIDTFEHLMSEEVKDQILHCLYEG